LIDQHVETFAKKKHPHIISSKDVPAKPTRADEEDDYLTASPQDPLESFNRVIHIFNGILDTFFLEPLAYIYRDATPQAFQTGVHNFWHNLSSPLYMINHLLQGNMKDFFSTGSAFVINTIWGGLGYVDMASGLKINRTQASFDQTLASWGMESGPYLVLPLLGPSSFRGFLGTLGDMSINQMSKIAANDSRTGNKSNQQKHMYLAVWGISIVDKRAEMIPFIEEIKKEKDSYAAIRSVMVQRQKAMEQEARSR